MRIQVEKRKGKNYVVARDQKGHIYAQKLKDRRSIETFKEIFERNKTFDPRIQRHDDKRVKVTSIDFVSTTYHNGRKLQGSPFIPTIRHKGSLQYVIKAYDKRGKEIISITSKNIYDPNSNYHTKQAAKAEAWRYFKAKLGSRDDGRYSGDPTTQTGRADMERGEKRIYHDQIRIKEGWRYFA